MRLTDFIAGTLTMLAFFAMLIWYVPMLYWAFTGQLLNFGG